MEQTGIVWMLVVLGAFALLWQAFERFPYIILGLGALLFLSNPSSEKMYTFLYHEQPAYRYRIIEHSDFFLFSVFEAVDDDSFGIQEYPPPNTAYHEAPKYIGILGQFFSLNDQTYRPKIPKTAPPNEPRSNRNWNTIEI